MASLDQAATEALDLVRKFADEPLDDPHEMLSQLDAARTKLQAAVAAPSVEGPITTPQLQAAYMDMITDAFADVLMDMQGNDVDILVDCLQSGLDLMNQEERDFFLEEDDDDTTELPHDQRRREAGFEVEAAV